MSTKKTTTTTANFDPYGMNTYNALQGPLTTGLRQNVQDPWTAIGGNQQLAFGNNNIFGPQQDRTSAMVASWADRGLSQRSPLLAQQLNQMASSTRSQQGGMLSNLLLQAGNVQQGSATAAGSYQPLQTGGVQQQYTTGFGSWAGPVAGLLLAGAKAGMAA